MKSFLILLVFGTSSVQAMELDPSVRREGCSPIHKDNAVEDFHGLIQNISIMCQRDERGRQSCKDNRTTLSKAGSKLGLSQQDMEKAAFSSLRVDCGSDGFGSGTLYGNCGQFLTNVHVLESHNGKTVCHVTNQGLPKIDQVVELNSENSLKFTDDVPAHRNLDLVAIKLPQPISGGKCFDLDPSSMMLTAGERIVIISGQQAFMKRIPNEPVVTSCLTRQVNPAADVQNSNIYSDCQTTEGTSGSMVLWHKSDGNWYLKGVHAGGGPESDNYKPYGGPNNEHSVGLDFAVHDRLIQFQETGSN